MRVEGGGSSYEDADARAAVDGSSVSVGQATVAEDAEALDGDPPSAYKTPSTTNSEGIGGGYHTVATSGGTTSLDGQLVDAVRFNLSSTMSREVTFELELSDGTTFSRTLSVDDSSDSVTVNFGAGTAKSASMSGDTGYSGTSHSVEIHVIALPNHTHTL